ncbi:hypothetical protein PBRA_004537, partial [Plasmodiophora brassicae]
NFGVVVGADCLRSFPGSTQRRTIDSTHALIRVCVAYLYGFYMVGLSRPQLSIIYGQSRPIVSRWIDQYESDRTSVEEAPPTTALLGHWLRLASGISTYRRRTYRELTRIDTRAIQIRTRAFVMNFVCFRGFVKPWDMLRSHGHCASLASVSLQRRIMPETYTGLKKGNTPRGDDAQRPKLVHFFNPIEFLSGMITKRLRQQSVAGGVFAKCGHLCDCVFDPARGVRHDVREFDVDFTMDDN